MSEERRDIEAEDLEPKTADQPTVKLDRVEDPGLPTSDPVFPTASPPLKPPVTSAGDGDDVAESKAPTQPPKPVSPAAGLSTPGTSSLGSPGAPNRVPPTPRPPRSAEQIRADIEANRQQLSESVEVLRDKVNELTDWRYQVRKHRREITIAAAVVGFAVGARLMMRRRR